MITVGQLLDFVMENRKGKVFKGYTRGQVAAALTEGIEDGTLFYCATLDEKITGMILAFKIHEPKVLFVTENLAMKMSNLKEFARKAKIKFPGWSIEAMRHDKHRKYNTDRLYKKL